MSVMEKVILGISPGTRSIGIAIIKDKKLIDCRIKTFKGKWSEGKLSDIVVFIESLVKDYAISHIALKTINISRTSNGLVSAIFKIKALAVRAKIVIGIFTIHDLKRHLLRGQNRNKWSLMEHISNVYPELRFECQKEQHNKNAYYLKMFESVACALTYWQVEKGN